MVSEILVSQNGTLNYHDYLSIYLSMYLSIYHIQNRKGCKVSLLMSHRMPAAQENQQVLFFFSKLDGAWSNILYMIGFNQ